MSELLRRTRRSSFRTPKRPRPIALVLSLLVFVHKPTLPVAWTTLQCNNRCWIASSTSLSAKSRAHNKQAELAQKFARAKQQQQQQTTPTTTDPIQPPPTTDASASDDFAKLLNTTQRALPRKGDAFDDERAFLPDIQAGKTKQKVAKKKPKAPVTPPTRIPEKNTERLYFESLVNVETCQALGAIGAAELVPWVPPFLVDELIVVCDPRQSSADLRAAVQYLKNQDCNKHKWRVIGITADAPPQARGWWGRLKEANQVEGCDDDDDDDSTVQLFSDSHLEWMTAHEVLDWSLTLLVFDTDGVVTRMESNVDPRKIVSMVQPNEKNRE